ncbi:MAG: fasciclin domain-containing protein [Candidatus Woesearchaeota archaeon]
MKKHVAIPLAVLMIGIMATPILAMRGPTIVDTALAVNDESGEFSILIAALQAEGKLINQLMRNGQYTVFAPTDEAFLDLFVEIGKTPGEVLADKELLSSVLGYHVVRGNRDSTAVTSSTRMRSINGNWIMVDGTQLTDQQGRESNMVLPDVRASNGVIHVIDKVILP